VTTRGVLFDSVRAWTRRTADPELDAALPGILQHVEARVAREIVHSSQVVVAQITISGRSGPLPSDCLEIRSLSLASGSRRRLELVTPEQLREGGYWEKGGDPLQYAIENRAIYLAPAAGDDTVFDLSYYRRFPPLVVSADTNYLLTNYPDLYLYAMLAETMAFVQDAEAQMGYEAKYADTRRALLEQDIDFRTSGSGLRRRGTNMVV